MIRGQKQAENGQIMDGKSGRSGKYSKQSRYKDYTNSLLNS